ncbi:cyclic peptide export ABC transporter [Terasakiella sp. A23]|uniref:cyclic peptide export ABC transporter n=1 Tax=Terasakiella sp. FCG-A23 TaxID=3080561 RepID=UPI0029551258|nr:cyclic peptide export ABC transporter [Terasakiella sp. A23]MDV7340256.1 cyclic peptide export ABC transporter [Terasakiella sp. A23]
MNIIKQIGILDFIHRETQGITRKLFILTTSAGVANALNLAIINAAVESIANDGPKWTDFALFALSLTLFVYSLRYILYESTQLAEQAIASVRIRLANKVRKIDLLSLESIGAADIHSRVSRDTTAISQAARPLFACAQGIVMILVTLIYIGAVSPIAMGACLLLIVAGGGYYMQQRSTYEEGLQTSSDTEDRLYNDLDNLLKGFKEVRLNKPKSEDVYSEFRTSASKVRRVRGKVMLLFSDNIVFVEMFFMLLLGTIVFVLPNFSDGIAEDVTKIVAAILFFFQPLGNVTMAIPMFSAVNVTVDNLKRLENELDDVLKKQPDNPDQDIEDYSNFKNLTLKDFGFAYHDHHGKQRFHVGPFNTTLNRGEIVFLVGGNGSGKTTFMKLLTHLYQPTEGALYVDDTEIDTHNVQSLRNMFSCIFTDFHLFDKLYGLQEVDEDKVHALLKMMEIDHKTGYENGAWMTTDLSTGQRKRLAMVTAYLEDKPIYIFDEVAADQDPQFRKYFYETLLKDLKKAGKTIIVVSHDDHYFHVGDRIWQMDYGQLSEIKTTRPPRRRSVKTEDKS